MPESPNDREANTRHILELQRVGFVHPLSCKADIYTHIGINHRPNQWKISEVLYSL